MTTVTFKPTLLHRLRRYLERKRGREPLTVELRRDGAQPTNPRFMG